MRSHNRKNHAAKFKPSLHNKINWRGIVAIATAIAVIGAFALIRGIVPAISEARSATDTSPYPYFEPDTKVSVYTGYGVNGWESVPFAAIPREKEFLYDDHLYDIDPNGWVRVNLSVTATETSLIEANRTFEPYNSRLPELEDLVRFVDDQNNHQIHNRAGACQAGNHFWFQGILYQCVTASDNPDENLIISTYHVMSDDGQVIPVEEFALARGDSLEEVYAAQISYVENKSAAVLSSGGSGNGFPTDIGFAGQHFDSATGLIYMGGRYYDPQLGRFISPDSVVPEQGDPQALNRYSYVRNNPVKYIDPSGHCWGIASGIRGLPTYDVTCNNLDMALTIVQHPDTSAWDKTVAGAYIVGEGVSHGMVVYYGGVAIASSVKAATTAGTITTAACADGDCANEANFVKVAVDNGLTAIRNGIGQGYNSFDAFKYSQGTAGNGMAWHHIVEQNSANINQFGAQAIQNTNNLIRLPHGAGLLHQQISGYYSSIQPLVTGSQSLTIRQWLQTQSFEFQWKFGIDLIQRFGGGQYIIDQFGGP